MCVCGNLVQCTSATESCRSAHFLLTCCYSHEANCSALPDVHRSTIYWCLPFTDVCVQHKVMPHMFLVRQTQHKQSAFHRFFVKCNACGYLTYTEPQGTAPRRVKNLKEGKEGKITPQCWMIQAERYYVRWPNTKFTESFHSFHAQLNTAIVQFVFIVANPLSSWV